MVPAHAGIYCSIEFLIFRAAAQRAQLEVRVKELKTNFTKPPIPFVKFVKCVAAFSKFCILNVSINSGMTRTLNCTAAQLDF